MRQYTGEEQRRIAMYGLCQTPGCDGAPDTRLVDIDENSKRLERFCPDCMVVQ
jgi:hypothetical protein